MPQRQERQALMIKRTFEVVIETDDQGHPSDQQVRETIASNLEYDYGHIHTLTVRLVLATATRKPV